MVLPPDAQLTLTCRGGRGTPSWGFKKDDVPYFQVDPAQNRRPPGPLSYRVTESPGASALTLLAASWKHTGVYVCTDNHTAESREVAVFVPGGSRPAPPRPAPPCPPPRRRHRPRVSPWLPGLHPTPCTVVA